MDLSKWLLIDPVGSDLSLRGRIKLGKEKCRAREAGAIEHNLTLDAQRKIPAVDVFHTLAVGLEPSLPVGLIHVGKRD